MDSIFSKATNKSDAYDIISEYITQQMREVKIERV